MHDFGYENGQKRGQDRLYKSIHQIAAANNGITTTIPKLISNYVFFTGASRRRMIDYYISSDQISEIAEQCRLEFFSIYVQDWDI